MKAFPIPSRDVRLPRRALEALAEGRAVAVTRYGKTEHVVLAERQYAQVAPLLEALEEGVSVSPELLMTRSDVELARELADDREPTEAEEAQIARLVEESGR
ncbi:MAG: hypothetical protein WD844_15315 [Thermoleophilaceae bacterium]